MNITGTLPPTGDLKPNLKASPSLVYARESRGINTRVLTPQVTGGLSEGSDVAFQLYSFHWQQYLYRSLNQHSLFIWEEVIPVSEKTFRLAK
jgi:hypothetical protein